MSDNHPRIVITRQLPESSVSRLADNYDTFVWPDVLPPSPNELRQLAADADALLCLLTDQVDADFLRANQHMRVISNYAVGYDNIDVEEATRLNIPVGNTPGVLTETSADLAFALLMSAARRLTEASAYVHDGKWQTWHPTSLLGYDIHGKTLGVVGLGKIGQAVARRAGGGFGMKVLYFGGSDKQAAEAIGATETSLDQLLAESDFISLHVPLSSATHHLINARSFALMKSTCVLVNTSRGPIIDPDSLYEALTQNRLSFRN